MTIKLIDIFIDSLGIFPNLVLFELISMRYEFCPLYRLLTNIIQTTT